MMTIQVEICDPFAMWFLLLFLSLSPAETSLPPSTAEFDPSAVTGVVRIIRAHPETEVFFKDRKDSLIIPKGTQHNQIYEACEESRKKGTPVTLKIDIKNRRILSLPGTSKKDDADKATSSPVSAPGSL